MCLDCFNHMPFQQTNVPLVSQTAVSHLNMEFFSLHLTTNSLVQPPEHISHVIPWDKWPVLKLLPGAFSWSKHCFQEKKKFSEKFRVMPIPIKKIDFAMHDKKRTLFIYCTYLLYFQMCTLCIIFHVNDLHFQCI